MARVVQRVASHVSSAFQASRSSLSKISDTVDDLISSSPAQHGSRSSTLQPVNSHLGGSEKKIRAVAVIIVVVIGAASMWFAGPRLPDKCLRTLTDCSDCSRPDLNWLPGDAYVLQCVNNTWPVSVPELCEPVCSCQFFSVPRGVYFVRAWCSAPTAVPTGCFDECKCRPLEHAQFYGMMIASTYAGILGAFTLVQAGRSAHLRSVTCYQAFSWIAGLFGAGYLEYGSFCSAGFPPQASGAGLPLRAIPMFLGGFWIESLLISRVRALEASCRKTYPGGGRCLGRMWLLQQVLIIIVALPLAVVYQMKLADVYVALEMGAVIWFFLMFATAGCGCSVFVSVLRDLTETSKQASLTQSDSAALIDKNWRAVAVQLVGVSVSFATSVPMLIGAVWSDHLFDYGDYTNETAAWFFIVAQIVDMLANATAAFLLSGGHRVEHAQRFDGLTCSPSRCLDFGARPQSSSRESHLDESDEMQWMAVVADLAKRGITVTQLLAFYKQLGGDIMSHFRPDVHTTNDVVRQAIIPKSRDAGSAYVFVASAGDPPQPERMVTHSWGNIFRDLVAAVIADALGETTFGLIANLLVEDVSVLDRMLKQSGSGNTTYWICAFAVNQHASICGGNPHGDVDSLTGVLHPTCDCGVQKVFNATPPLTACGKSIHCELNKFHDMMGMMAVEVPMFAEVIAVDPPCELFRRAWCVAELVQARCTASPQHLKFQSRDALLRNESSLRGLRVTQMRASRPEDVEEILSHIPDTDAFDCFLQELIFDKHVGLLASWHGMDAAQRMGNVGRLIRWSSADRTGSVWRCWLD